MSGNFSGDTVELHSESDGSACSFYPSCDWGSSCKGDHSFSGPLYPTESDSGSFDSYYDTKSSYFARKQRAADLEKKKREAETSKAAEKGGLVKKPPVPKKSPVSDHSFAGIKSPIVKEKAPLIIRLSDDSDA